MRFRRIPIEIEAIQWAREAYEAVCDFIQEGQAKRISVVDYPDGTLRVGTPHGPVRAHYGDWIVRKNGVLYVIEAHIFANVYEAVP